MNTRKINQFCYSTNVYFFLICFGRPPSDCFDRLSSVRCGFYIWHVFLSAQLPIQVMRPFETTPTTQTIIFLMRSTEFRRCPRKYFSLLFSVGIDKTKWSSAMTDDAVRCKEHKLPRIINQNLITHRTLLRMQKSNNLTNISLS